MGEVYKARDTRLDRIVAIKVLPEILAGDPQFRERFEREARAISQLTHPHICTLHDIGRQDLTDFLVMEYLEGETLAERLAKGALPLDQALTIAIQITSALDAAHRAGIVHRDLKPGNIMLTKAGAGATRQGSPHAKLLDFGLAKASAPAVAGTGLSMLPTTPPGLTVQGAILGTFQYMAPEQLEGREADMRTDIFAFGAVLYEMLTGKKAFEGKSHASLIGAILKDEPPPISTVQPLSPAALDRVVRKCLAKDPETRWHSTHDLHDELTWIAEASSQVALVAPAARRGSGGRVAWALGAMAVLAIGALAIPATLYVRRPVSEPVVTRFDVVTPPTGDAFSFALSHDGRQLAFVANGERGRQLWLRPLDDVRAQPLPGTEGAEYPFWAPDGRAIGFFADGKLKRIDLMTGGTALVLADAAVGRGGTWNPDGVIVFAPGGSDPLMRVAATGGTAAPVTRSVALQGGHRWPQFLPDGRRFLFSITVGQPHTQGIYVGSLDGGEPTRVMPAETAGAFAAPGYLLLVSQGVLAAYPFDAVRATVVNQPMRVAQAVGTDDGAFHSAFSVSAAGVLAHRAGAGSRRQLVWVDRAGRVDAIGPQDESGPANPDLAPDGQRVSVNRGVQGNFDVWLIEVGRGVPSRFTFDVAIDSGALWSPDGSHIVFRSARNGVYDLFEKPASSGADEHPLFVTSQSKAAQDWSRDGRFLLYSTQGPKTGSDLWALPLTGDRPSPGSGRPESVEGRKPFAVLQSSFDEIEGQFSPDGRWLAYASNESGRYEIYIRTFPDAGVKRQVSVAGGVQPRWKRDGHELFYVAPDTRLMAVPIRLAPDPHTLEAGAPVALFPTRLATGGNVVGTGFLARPQYAVAPDGRFLMNVAADEAVTSPITIVQNWTAALKK
jgi:Tol biopolymer transport system component